MIRGPKSHPRSPSASVHSDVPAAVGSARQLGLEFRRSEGKGAFDDAAAVRAMQPQANPPLPDRRPPSPAVCVCVCVCVCGVRAASQPASQLIGISVHAETVWSPHISWRERMRLRSGRAFFRGSLVVGAKRASCVTWGNARPPPRVPRAQGPSGKGQEPR